VLLSGVDFSFDDMAQGIELLIGLPSHKSQLALQGKRYLIACFQSFL
jgi:hypothetical protein